MSQIFDALLRSEAERDGNGSTPDVEATELLRYVEEVASKRASASLHGEYSSAATNEQDGVLELDNALQHRQDSQASGKIITASPDEQRDIWRQFQSVPVVHRPEGTLVCYSGQGSPTAEAFRLLSVRLRDSRQVRALKTLLITSTVPQEGKSTVASNLACTLAKKREEKVLLLEGDIHRPTLSKIFNLKCEFGLCELLQGQCGLSQGIYHLEGPGVWILPAGRSPATPLELLQSRRLRALMDELKGLFDWIVIDSPPVLPLADTSIWSRVAEGILLVTRQGTTEKRRLNQGLQALDSEKLIGTLLNNCKASTYSDYYYAPSHPPAHAAD
jgi:capsular exopolysaccharide synthesis family protein